MHAGVAAQFLLPQKLIGRIVYRAARSECVWFKNILIRSFMRLFPIDLTEAELTDGTAYTSFNAFFTRALQPGARALEGDERTVASPVDGTITEFGELDGNRLLQAKGMPYTLDGLLAEQPELLASFHGGRFMTIYLAPHNYHRIHAPVSGQLDRGRYVPGRRFSVNRTTVSAIDGLFCRNERVSLWLSSATGYSVVVMVGALNVASLTTVISGEIEPGPERLLSPATPPVLARGDELGRFNLGSTIVMLFPRGAVEWLDTIRPDQPVRLGQAVGRLLPE